MRQLFFLPCLGLLLALSACVSAPQSGSSDADIDTLSRVEQIQILLVDAHIAPSPEKERLELQASQLLIEEQQLDLASQVLAGINTTSLEYPLYARYIALQSQLDILYGNYGQALEALKDPKLTADYDQLPLPQQLELSQIRASAYAMLGQHYASAEQRIFIDSLLSAELKEPNQEAIWRSLMLIPVPQLSQHLQHSQEDFQGWIELALIAKDNQGDLDEQLRQLDAWTLKWANHPAALQLPGGLALIRELAINKPQQIALIVPLTGKLAPYGKAVRDGFIAALYQTKEQGGQVPRLQVYNSDASDDFIQLYHQVVIDGAELVIGPLNKQRLQLLFDEMTLPVPTLALNRVENYGPAPEQLFQFGLAPQDEAIQIADIAYLENYRQAMIIAPRGEWGEKVSQAFANRWQQLEGTVITRSMFTGQQDYSSSIKNALSLQLSEARAKRIGSLAGQHIEFVPRRRQDIDMVFLLAKPDQARSIKPLLDYHYARDLPIYASSRVYSGLDPKKNRDINGVHFIDMPWVLNPPSPLHKLINQQASRNKQLQHMYALGIDSFQLHPRLRQLDEITTSRFYGNTGTLRLNQKREIERKLLFAKIKNGRAKLTPLADQAIVTREGEVNAHQAIEKIIW
jgi:outer membrane PBP1 activator LpoA protein